jgi:L-lactate dehydrogenase complex protein LldF
VEGPGGAELGPHLDAAAAVGTLAPGRPGSTPTEEIDVDRMIVACQADVVETGLRQWIARLADEAPSHIVAAAPHRDRRRIPDLLVEQACTGSPRRRQGELVRFARERLRRQFLGAEVGVGTADLAVAETGSLVLVTDQPNTRLATALPEVHVVVLGLDQVIAGWDQADLVLALHHQTSRAAGQANGRRPATTTSTSTAPTSTTSTTVITGPRQPFELDGPRELHVVVLDNGRSRRLGRVPTERGLR